MLFCLRADEVSKGAFALTTTARYSVYRTPPRYQGRCQVAARLVGLCIKWAGGGGVQERVCYCGCLSPLDCEDRVTDTTSGSSPPCPQCHGFDVAGLDWILESVARNGYSVEEPWYEMMLH